MNPWMFLAAAAAAKARRGGKHACWQGPFFPEDFATAGERPGPAEPFPEAASPAAAPGDWQYKIVRGSFATREAMEALQQEQAAFGWRLVEVLDERRVRFGRPSAVAAKDVARDGNPYSTTSRIGGPRAAVVAVLALLALAVALGLTLVSVRAVRLSTEPAMPTMVVTTPAPPSLPPPPVEPVRALPAPTPPPQP
jgi:hypothetical protein